MVLIEVHLNLTNNDLESVVHLGLILRVHF
jgi:hypothetical protein